MIRWLNELTEVIQKEMQYRAAEVPFAKFATPDRMRFYRPVLRQLEEQNGVTHRAEICFGEHVIGVAENPDDLQVMEAALRLAARFRTEVLERFSTPRNSEDVARFERVLKRIERESFDEGFRDPSLLVELFEGKDRETVEKIYADWEGYRNDQKTGKLDLSFERQDHRALKACLTDMRRMNQAFMLVASGHYAEMLGNASSARHRGEVRTAGRIAA